MNTEEILRRHELVNSPVYLELKQEALNYIVKLSTSPMDEKVIKGMLLLLNFFDRWEDEYEQALARRKEQ